MKHIAAIALLCSLFLLGCQSIIDPSKHQTVFEQSGGEQTATYEEIIAWWTEIDEASPYLKLQTFGTTDAGLPLHLVIVNADRNFSREHIQKSGKVVVLVNNGIHPGEPDGIDASMLFVRDLLSSEDIEQRLDSVVLLIIPVYNVGGALNRNCCSRANQNGPESYGFRGNARNLDLNRDFIKADSRNAKSFQSLFSAWDPDIYLETHVSNGADYPYTMTYLASQSDKLGTELSSFVDGTLSPALYAHMEAENDAMIPYVNLFGTPPDSGYACFYDHPRYSTGYAALFQSIGLLTETHMLKPFDQRVASTKRFLHGLVHACSNHATAIKKAREQARMAVSTQNDFPLNWSLDSSQVSTLLFSGYKAYRDTSEVTDSLQLYYDRDQPWTANIPYYNKLKPTETVEAPDAYLVPYAWQGLVESLKRNGVSLRLLERDTVIQLTAYHLDEYKTADRPYEGHYLHYKTVARPMNREMRLLGGSYYIVSTDQRSRRFLIETLEPSAIDSYFSWNFFDEVLQQKEWYSTYVFDREAASMMKDPAIAQEIQSRKQQDSSFARNPKAILYTLYQMSDHYERDRHLIYPVFRIDHE